MVPQLRAPDGSLHHSLRREPSVRRALGLAITGVPALTERVRSAADYAQPHWVDWATGAAMLISRPCYTALGGLDESYFLYSEETDLSLRARDIGLRTWYEPHSVMVHVGGQSGRSEVTHAMLMINRVRLYRRRHGAAASWCYFLLITGGQAKRALGSRGSRHAVAALLRPSLRPPQLGCSGGLLPR